MGKDVAAVARVWTRWGTIRSVGTVVKGAEPQLFSW
jgi:hypothetical protein